MGITLARMVRPARGLGLSTASGTSVAAQTIHTMAIELNESQELAVISLRPFASLTELAHAAEEATHDDWDGYGGHAVQSETIALARAFIDQLPAFVPPPDVTPEPDGEISLDWRAGPWRTFSVSIGPQGRLTYAGLFGRVPNARGTEVLGDFIPASILTGLTRLLQS